MATATLAIEIERKNWELVALCLLLGVAEVASKLPPETLEQLMDLLQSDLSLPSALRIPLPLAGEGARRAGEGGQPSPGGDR